MLGKLLHFFASTVLKECHRQKISMKIILCFIADLQKLLRFYAVEYWAYLLVGKPLQFI